MVAELPGGGKDFGSEVRGQISEVWKVSNQTRKTKHQTSNAERRIASRYRLFVIGVQATRLPLQALSRVKGCASRGGESGVEHDHDYEHEHEHEHKEEIL